MKTAIVSFLQVLLFVLFTIHVKASCNSNIDGVWSGFFMEKFKVVMTFSTSESNSFTGRIEMFDGKAQIQNDVLTSIRILDDSLFFLIPAKNTGFNGRFDYTKSALKGYFVFPDGSKHPVEVEKAEKIHEQDLSLGIPTEASLKKVYTPEELQADLEFLKQNLIEYHPQLYLFNDEKSFQREYGQIEDEMGRSLTIKEFYKIVAPLTGSIKCSHTGLRLSESYQSELCNNGRYFPLDLFIQGNRAWIISSFSYNDKIEPGSELLSVNNMSISDIIEKIFTLLPAEGDNLTSKYFYINKDFNSLYQFFDDAEEYLITYKSSKSGKISSEVVRHVEFNHIGKDEDYGSNLIRLEISREENTAYLKVKNFGMHDVNGFISFVDSAFMQIKKQQVKHLILDLRGNQGGHPIFAAILYSYLTQKEFVYFDDHQRIEEFQPLYHPMQANVNSFKGECYTLIDGGCLSTAGHLISLLKYHQIAVFIGEEPGSWFHCNDNSKRIKLPNTAIEANIPQTTFITAVEGYKMGDSFLVDYKIQLSADDIIEKRDIYLLVARKLIKEGNSVL